MEHADPIPNNFNYQPDLTGLRCPLHAHIRKMNPRGEAEAEIESEERQHRIARRGITYGERYDGLQDRPAVGELPSKNVGLLFMCFQSNIENQFEFLQKRWANRKDLPRADSFIDPVIGQHHAPEDQRWSVAWGDANKVSFSFHGFVKLKGGEYFFAPSISALKNI
jgi:deferrochelatase/peroxidase EfeB